MSPGSGRVTRRPGSGERQPGTKAVAGSAVTLAGAQVATSSRRAEPQPNRSLRGEWWPTMASSVFAARSTRQAGRVGQRSPRQRGDDRVVAVLGYRFHDGPGDPGGIQARRVAAAQPRQHPPGRRMVSGDERVLDPRRPDRAARPATVIARPAAPASRARARAR